MIYIVCRVLWIVTGKLEKQIWVLSIGVEPATFRLLVWTLYPVGGGGGGGLVCERGGDARRKFWMQPLKGTDMGVAQAFSDP